MLTLLRYFLLALGLLAAIPLIVVVLLLFTTPITLVGLLYLIGYIFIVIGSISFFWRYHRSYVLLLAGSILILLIISIRLLLPPLGSQLILTTLPSQTEPRWLNRVFDEQDMVLFGARLAPLLHAVSATEEHTLVAALAQTYTEIRSLGVTPLSPVLATYLNQQHVSEFDALVAEIPSGSSPRSGIIFLHGYGGNFTLQCWLVAEVGNQLGAVTVCPSTSRYGDWWNPESVAILEATRAYLQERGVQRIYLAGLSNGAIGASRLAQRFESDLAGLILISGADPDAPISKLPVLLIQGSQDERIPTPLVEQYAIEARPYSTYYLFESDHFVLLKQSEQVQQMIADWLTEQEARQEGQPTSDLANP